MDTKILLKVMLCNNFFPSPRSGDHTSSFSLLNIAGSLLMHSVIAVEVILGKCLYITALHGSNCTCVIETRLYGKKKKNKLTTRKWERLGSKLRSAGLWSGYTHMLGNLKVRQRWHHLRLIPSPWASTTTRIHQYRHTRQEPAFPCGG